MDYSNAVAKIYDQADFNPACFLFTEEEARNKKLWRDPRPMPTQSELEAAEVIVNQENSDRKAAKDVLQNILKDKGASIKSRQDALIEYLGLDI